MSESLIKLEGVTKVFLTDEVETHALSGIHMDIKKGEYVSIAGPSGCGKSTLLSILGLLDSPTEGSYVLNGRPRAGPLASWSAPASATARSASSSNRSTSSAIWTVFENVELPLTYRDMPAAERKAAATEALREGRHGPPGREAPSRPSSPAVNSSASPSPARSPANPRVLLADEPTGNLDSKNGDSVMQLLAELHKGGATIVMVTHDTRFARHADRTIHIFDGRVVREQVEQAH